MNKKKLLSPLKITVVSKDEVVFTKEISFYPISIGRSKKCDVPLPQFSFLSRQHCAVTLEEGSLQIIDLESANGIFFEGKKVQKVNIKKESQISIGDIQIQFEVRDLSNEETQVAYKEPAPLEVASQKENLKAPPSLPKEAPALPSNLPPALAKKDPVATKKEANSQSTEPTVNKTVTASSTEVSNPKIENVGLSKQPPSIPVHKVSKQSAIPPKKSKKTKPISQEISFGQNLLSPHQHSPSLRPNQRVLEGYVTWMDQIYESRVFLGDSSVVLGDGSEDSINIPTLKMALPLAFYDGQNTQFEVPKNLNFSIKNTQGFIERDELISSKQAQAKGASIYYKMNPSDVVSFDLGGNMAVHFRYAPTPRHLSKGAQLLDDPELKKTALTSGLIHLALLLVILFTEPKSKAPVIKNVPERYARLLVKPPEPKPLPPPPPPKKPEPPKKEEKVVAKKTPPKKQPVKKQPTPKVAIKKQTKPTKVVRVAPSKVLNRINKYPVEVDRPMKPAEKPVVSNIQSVGALAALNAFSSKPTISNQPVAVNINKNAGGQTALNTGGVIGTLKTNTGKLAAGGLASVKTKGLGYGTGTGYGVQGVQGTSGARAVAGVVVGAPSLVRLSKEDGLTRQQVLDVVKRYMGEIQQCYERSLLDNPNIAGRVEYEWEIASGGSVQWAKVKKSEVTGADSLNGCVTGVFKKMKFPVAKNGQNTIPNIGFPFGRL